MCGRYTHLFTWEELHRLSTLTSPPIDLPPSWNVAPTQSAPVIRLTDHGRTLNMLRWGLVPFWAADTKIGSSLINARSETIAEKPAFRAAFKARRCLVPASGFYEWKREGDHKQPFYIRSASEEPLLLAGLWEQWRGVVDGAPVETLETFTILTTSPNELMKPLHDRMPVIIDPNDQELWLNPRSDRNHLQHLMTPYTAELMMAYPVTTHVNSPRHNDADCITQMA